MHEVKEARIGELKEDYNRKGTRYGRNGKTHWMRRKRGGKVMKTCVTHAKRLCTSEFTSH